MVLYSRAIGLNMKTPVLVLNANFQPLHVCDTRRALHLIIGGKARLVANGRGSIHTVRFSYPIPSIIQLQKMIHPPRPYPHLSKREVFRRDDYTCQYCGRQTMHLTVDHVLPRYRGGAHVWNNLVAACPPCNRKKGGRLPEEVHMHLKRPPMEPPRSAMYLFGHYLTEFGEWRSYLEGW
jgi:5-methylcytosine-specific restriction endonuclease McrA